MSQPISFSILKLVVTSLKTRIEFWMFWNQALNHHHHKIIQILRQRILKEAYWQSPLAVTGTWAGDLGVCNCDILCFIQIDWSDLLFINYNEFHLCYVKKKFQYICVIEKEYFMHSNLNVVQHGWLSMYVFMYQYDWKRMTISTFLQRCHLTEWLAIYMYVDWIIHFGW